VPCAELAELFERSGGLSGVDGFGAHGDTLLEVAGEARGYQDGGGVWSRDYARLAPGMPVITS